MKKRGKGKKQQQTTTRVDASGISWSHPKKYVSLKKVPLGSPVERIITAILVVIVMHYAVSSLKEKSVTKMGLSHN